MTDEPASKCLFFNRDRAEIEILINDMIERRLLSRQLTHKELKLLGDLFQSVAETALFRHVYTCPVQKQVDILVGRYDLSEARLTAKKKEKRLLDEGEASRTAKVLNIAKILIQVVIGACAVAAFVKTFI